MNKTVFLVKFEAGYYAAKQSGWDWSFTNDPMLAQQYQTEKKAQHRADWGKDLLNDGEPNNSTDPTHIAMGSGKVEIEKWEVKTVMEKV